MVLFSLPVNLTRFVSFIHSMSLSSFLTSLLSLSLFPCIVIQTPVQKWQTKDVTAVSSEKSKHIRIDIDGPTPTSLHFHAGSKDNADAIMAKLESSKALSSPSSSSPPVTRSTPAPDTKKASVHFSSASPVIIPEPDEGDDGDVVDEEEEEEEPPHEEEVPVPQRQQYAPPPRAPPPAAPPAVVADEEEQALALYDFTADGEDELSVMEGERLVVLEKDGDEWWKCRNVKGKEGVVPASYLEVSFHFARNCMNYYLISNSYYFAGHCRRRIFRI